jgi:enoyl-CoA hydratase/carnithine racemase
MSELAISIIDGVATLTLNRPAKANALSESLVEELHDGFDSAMGGDVRLLVLRGEGRNFCAGFDFSGFEDAPVAALCWRFVRIEQLLQKLAHAPFSTMALAHGGCFGAGADIVAACATAIATADAKFRMPGWKFGLALGTRRLAARVGPAAARRLLEGAAVVTGAQALELGLIAQLTESVQWDAQSFANAGVAGGLARRAQVRLLEILREDTRAADMASLVESLAEGDLKSRIAAFRNSR